MKKLFWGLCLILPALHCAGQAQESNTTITGVINFYDQYEAVLIIPNDRMADGEPITAPIGETGRFSWNFDLDKPKFIKITIIPKAKDRQLPVNFPLYIMPGSKNRIALHYNDSTYLSITGGNLTGGNKALVMYSNARFLKMKDMFLNPPDETNSKESLDQYFDFMNDYLTRFDVKDTAIKHYLEAWAMNDYLDGLGTLERKYGERGKDRPLPEDVYHFPESPVRIYDYPEALYFNATFRNVNKYLQITDTSSRSILDPEEKLKAKFKLFNEHFSSPALRRVFNYGLLSNYISSIHLGPGTDFNRAFAAFKKMTDEVGDTAMRKSLVRRFSNLRYTSGGAEMPDIELEDTEGNPVALNKFKGKYVYIDLWASWCVPCIKEIPSLQQLQHDYKDKNIVFLSISIDESKQAWKNKIKELHLTGNQLYQGDSNFGSMMNVQGIPHFFLYDPSGRLMMYKAPRPSTTTIRNVFDAL